MNKNLIKSLIIGIVTLLLGIGMVVAGYVINYKSDSTRWYIYLMFIIGAIILFIGICNLYYVISNKYNLKKLSVKQMCVLSIMASLSVILYYFAKFNLPFFPSWLDVQFSDIPALISSFMYGPVAGSIVIVIRFLVKLPATMTAGVGEIADLLIGLTLVISSGLIYKKKHSLKGALVSMTIGMLLATAVAIFANWSILIPAYMKIAHFPMAALVGGMSYIKGVNSSNFMVYYLFVGVLPFNLFRYILVFIITFLLYKRLHIFIEYVTKEKNDEEISNSEYNSTKENN